MSDLRSGPLAAWTRAWLAGTVGVDQVVDAVTGSDAPHQVAGLAGVDDVAPLRELLVTWRRAGHAVRVALPVAGDVRGLPGPAEFRAAAIEAGEAVVGAGLAVVPEVIAFAPSSAPTSVRWRVFAADPAPADHQSVPDAQYELTTAIRDSASALASADVARWRDEIGGALHDARRAGQRVNLPPDHPPRAVALLAQAERVQAVLELARSDPIGGAVDRVGIATRDDALRPLATAVRRARVAAFNAMAQE